MATGNSKTKWNGDNHINPADHTELPPKDSKVFLSYSGKTPLKDILSFPKVDILPLINSKGGETHKNCMYFGDNLPILSTLMDNPNIAGKVRLIYIDPPFSTGSVFQSRTQKDAYTDLLTGPQYIEFMRRRLVFLRELLADDGSIYVHLDHNMAPYIKVVMDEIFGSGCFRNWITRKKSNPKNYTRKAYGNISDIILFYTKAKKYLWNKPHTKWTTEAALKEYQYIDEKTGRRYKKVPVHAPGERNGKTGQPWRGKLPPPGKHWQFPPAVLDEMDARGEIYWSPNGNPRRKIFLDDSKGKTVQDIWLDFRDAFNQNHKVTGYPTEKNADMLRMIIEASSDPGDIILDCFSGSGTTLCEASKLRRNWIGIDNSPEAIHVTLKRFMFGSEPMGDFVQRKKASNNVNYLLFRIMDFNLFASKPYNGELDALLEQWGNWATNI